MYCSAGRGKGWHDHFNFWLSERSSFSTMLLTSSSRFLCPFRCLLFAFITSLSPLGPPCFIIATLTTALRRSFWKSMWHRENQEELHLLNRLHWSTLVCLQTALSKVGRSSWARPYIGLSFPKDFESFLSQSHFARVEGDWACNDNCFCVTWACYYNLECSQR